MTGTLRDYLKKWTVNGTQTRSKADLFTSPVAAVRAKGSQVWDAEGRQYTDWISGLCAVTLGYGNEEVDDAVIRQIRDHGVTFPLPTEAEAEVAELLCEALGWPEQVRWVKTGSEATAAAMLVARAATGRRRIVSVGYHGWSPAHLPGPELVQLPIESPAAVESITDDTAGVLIEVLRNGSPEGQGDTGRRLDRVYDRCHDVGAAIIMDEIVTGFRWAVGGATEYLELYPPDLACFGKGMSNGYPLGALVGPRRLMQHAVNVSSTFGGEGVGLAACRAVLEIYKRENVISHLWGTGHQLMDALPEFLDGYAVHPRIVTDGPAVAQRAATRGVLLIPSGLNVTAAHSLADIEATFQALDPSAAVSQP